jgi:hypothetical protein
MCTNIQCIKNVTVTYRWAAEAGDFQKQLTGMPSVTPDEVIIRALNFNGQSADSNLYLVWSNLTNDFIASFCGGALAPHFPQTRIFLTNPVPNFLQFKLYTPTQADRNLVVSTITGDLAIHMDFIYYKKA